MPKAPINGIELYYEIAGDEGEWVVFAHGGEGTHLTWWKQVAAFRDRYRCVTYDARAFGMSGGGWTTPADTASDDLLGLIDHLGIDRTFLVGHSMGGLAVSAVAQQVPDRILGLVMGDTAFGFRTAALSRWAAMMMEKIPAGFNVFEHLYAPAFARDYPDIHYLHTAISRMNVNHPKPEGTANYLDAYVRMRDAPLGDYSDFAVPSLFIVGSEDELTLPSLMEGTAKAVNGAEFATIAGAGHSPFIEKTEIYNALLAEFFERAGKR
jgi:3-oxoadipate enol-lactonase